MSFSINGRNIDFSPGETVLEVALRSGIEIPHLCWMRDACAPSASCRMCLVEVQGSSKLQTSCTLPARDGMAVSTHTPRVLSLRRNLVELLLANHSGDCVVCTRSRDCELSKLAADLGVRAQRYSGIRKSLPIDRSSPALVRDPNKCILCGRCVATCHAVQGVGAIDFTMRGFKTRVAPAHYAGINVSGCVFCGQCVRACPTGALTDKSQVDLVIGALQDPDTVVVAQVAPAVPATLMDEVECSSVRAMLERLAGGLKRIGFHAVFDTSFAADLTILEEVSELVDRIQNGGVLPMLTSCSPAWVHYVETHHPELIPHLSTCKSPQQMAGALIKEIYPSFEELHGKRLVCVSIMPCTAKKFEAQDQGDVDLVLTTRELKQLFERFGMSLARCDQRAALDPPFSEASGAGRLFGGTGGVMEAALRTAHARLTGSELKDSVKIEEARGPEGVKTFTLDKLNFAVVNGLGRLHDVLDAIVSGRSELHFVEVMTCPGGCVGGGGQPYNVDPDAVKERLERLYRADRNSRTRVSHGNEEVQNLYAAWLGKPLGEVSHRLLHRQYTDRSAELRTGEG
jgi:iron-only hydrogenase group A